MYRCRGESRNRHDGSKYDKDSKISRLERANETLSSTRRHRKALDRFICVAGWNSHSWMIPFTKWRGLVERAVRLGRGKREGSLVGSDAPTWYFLPRKEPIEPSPVGNVQKQGNIIVLLYCL